MPHRFSKNTESICHSICVMCLLSFQSSFIRHVWFCLLNNFASSHVSRHLTLHLHLQYSHNMLLFTSSLKCVFKWIPFSSLQVCSISKRTWVTSGADAQKRTALCGSPTGYWRVAELFLVVFICFPNNYIPYIRSADYFEYIFVDQCRFLGSLPFWIRFFLPIFLQLWSQ